MNATDATNALVEISEFISPWGTHVFRNIYNHLFRTSTPYALKSPLPAELWAIILDMALVEIILPKPPLFVSCDTFPDYYYNWNPNSNYFRGCDAEWRNLRLVCRTWANLIDPHWALHREVASIPDLTNGMKTRSIGVGKGPRWEYSGFPPFYLDSEVFNVTKNITTICIGSPHNILKLRDNDRAKRKFIEFLFDWSKYFPNVDTFAFTPRGDVSYRFRFLTILEKSFPNLVSLRLEGECKRRPITIWDRWQHFTLPRLEILITGLNVFPKCSFPSLKHLVIPRADWHGSRRLSPKDSYFQLLHGHKEHLESLIIIDNSNASLSMGTEFWNSFPELRLFGAVDRKWPDFPLPEIPFSHPLEHLIVANLYTSYNHIHNFLLHISTLQGSSTQANLRSRFPNLRRVTCDQYKLSITEKQGLKRKCAELGIDMSDIVVRDRPAKSVAGKASGGLTKMLKTLGNDVLATAALAINN